MYREVHASTICMKVSLGEMESKDLGISTVIPGYGRTLKQFTIDDYKNLLKELTTLQDDKTVFTKGIKIRKEDII